MHTHPGVRRSRNATLFQRVDRGTPGLGLICIGEVTGSLRFMEEMQSVVTSLVIGI